MGKFLVTVCLTAALVCSVTLSFTQGPSASQTENQSNTDVKVWVNTHSGVYHCPGTRWYGVTESGTYMTQTEAQQHGYRPAYGKVCQSGASAATSATPSQQEKASTASATKCHALLVKFQGKSEEYFVQKTDEELSNIQDSIDECVRNAYLQLPRLDLSVAGVAAAMVARQLQARLDRVAYEALLKNYIDLQAKTAPKPSNARTVTLTISPLPNGFTRTLSVRGQENTCVAVEAMQLECKPTSPSSRYIFSTRLIAMLATPKPLPLFEHGFLIGCNPELSANCFPLVAGDYPAEYVGTDGISMAGIVFEDKPNDPPHHGTFVIYHRGEVP
jgi:hypothetical protein